jgi:predicted RNA-binding Zn ribbon-like protein
MASRNTPTVGRFGLESAPGGLRLVQDLVNTSLSARQGDPERDRLADLPTAEGWLRETLAEWSAATGRPVPDLVLRPRDLAPLRTLREQLRRSLRANAAHVDPDQHAGPAGTVDAAMDADVRLTLRPDGRVEHRPLAAGWQGVAGLVSIEILLADAAGTLSRLKSCAAPACGACFYDGSPNRARVWHDTKMCGNVPNLRASRARRKAV